VEFTTEDTEDTEGGTEESTIYEFVPTSNAARIHSSGFLCATLCVLCVLRGEIPSLKFGQPVLRGEIPSLKFGQPVLRGEITVNS